MKLFFAFLFLLPAVALGQLTPGSSNSRVYRLMEGDVMSMISSASDTAKDNALYSNKIYSDLGGRPIIYGMTTQIACDTVTTNLVLEGSIDDTTFVGVDSLAVSTNEVVSKKYKTVDLTNFRYPIWRLRYGAGSLALRGNKTPTGRIYFFVLTNYQNRL